MKRDVSTLRDILQAADAIERFLGDADETHFMEDDLLQSAVATHLLVLAEAAARLTSDARAGAPDVRWREIAALRSLLVRGESEIDWNLVWKTAVRDLPEIRRRAEELLDGSRTASSRGS